MYRLAPHIRHAALLLAAGVAAGFTVTLISPKLMERLFSSIFQMLYGLGQEIFQNQTSLQGTLSLFWHNLRAVMGMVVLGVVFGIVPLLGMLLNGTLLGVVLAFSLSNGQVLAFFAGVLPHAIFELPALIIGAGAGLYLGLGTFRKDWQGYLDAFRLVVDAVLVSMVLLILAAIVEVNITPLVLRLAR